MFPCFARHRTVLPSSPPTNPDAKPSASAYRSVQMPWDRCARPEEASRTSSGRCKSKWEGPHRRGPFPRRLPRGGDPVLHRAKASGSTSSGGHRADCRLGRGLASRFGFLKTKRRVSLERGISSASLHRAAHNGGDTTVTAAPVVEGRAPKARKLSTSATSTLSTSSKIRPRPRLPEFGAPLPPVSKSGSAAGSINSTNALGLPRGGSVSSTSSSRKQSHSEAIRTARPAPAPPMEVIRDAQLEEAVNNMISTSTTTTSKRSSTLYMPTASSMARMQATIKPVVDRPLPKPPKIEVATAKPFGPGSSREETTFDTSFNVPKPRVPSNPSEGLKRSMTKSVTFNTNPTVAGSGNGLKSAPSFSAGGGRATPSGPRAPLRPAMRSPSKSPAKTSSISGKGARDRAGGISSIKSRGIDAEAAQKRAEVKARQERRAEERQLREILSYEA